jgi:hypothetical protein
MFYKADSLTEKKAQKTDMHPVDLIRDNSMLVRQKFKFNGVPDSSFVYRRMPKQVRKASALSHEYFIRHL